jgi:hypothetical protein
MIEVFASYYFIVGRFFYYFVVLCWAILEGMKWMANILFLGLLSIERTYLLI